MPFGYKNFDQSRKQKNESAEQPILPVSSDPVQSKIPCRKNCSKILSCVLIVTSVLIVIFGSALLALTVENDRFPMGYAAEIWIGAFWIVANSIAMAAAFKKQVRCLRISYLVLGPLVAMLSAVFIIYGAFEVRRYERRTKDLNSFYSNYYDFEVEPLWKQLYAIKATLLALASLQMVLTIVNLSFSCYNERCCGCCGELKDYNKVPTIVYVKTAADGNPKEQQQRPLFQSLSLIVNSSVASNRKLITACAEKHKMSSSRGTETFQNVTIPMFGLKNSSAKPQVIVIQQPNSKNEKH